MGEELGARPKVMQPVPPAATDCGIEDLPDEVIEYILKLVSPYADFSACARVSSRWRDCCHRVSRSRILSFSSQLNQAYLLWSHQSTEDIPGNISKRYSHSAVFYPASLAMFVFGGCTSSSSTFNDLWTLDLSTRTWARPVAMGTYPSPKACSSLAVYQDCLLLFGGWTHPSLYPLHQSWKLFNELHIFHVSEKRWTQITADPDLVTSVWPPPTAGHSVTIHRDKMVVFGGLQKQRDVGFFQSSNDIWVFSVPTKTWSLQAIRGENRPSGRYGQSQIWVDETHFLVLGGCVGANNTELSDIWLVSMEEEEMEGEGGWSWHQMVVESLEHRGKDIWRHPACRVTADRVLVLGKSRVTAKKSTKDNLNQAPSTAHHHNHNTPSQSRNAIGSKPPSSRYQPPPVEYSSSSEDSESSEAGGGGAGGGAARRYQPVAAAMEVDGACAAQAALGLSSRLEGMDQELNRTPLKPRQKMLENRQRQLASLQRMEEKIRANSRQASAASPRPTPARSPPVLCPNHRMALYVLDTSRAVSDHVVTWLPPSPLPPGSDAPQESILYSLVAGRTELIMFGGLRKDISVGTTREFSEMDSVSNSLHFLVPRTEKI